MFAGNGAGEFLLPMVVYKSESVYKEWVRGGPVKTVYDCTKNGWFDSSTFEVWFFKQFLALIQHLKGPIVLIGDNLGSHFSTSVMQKCMARDTFFICLPPNATYLCQPLDVAVFRPGKISWKDILETWRLESRYMDNFPKIVFPSLLYKLVTRLKACNFVSGFHASGIYPLDRQQVLKRFPSVITSEERVDSEMFSESVLQVLKENFGVGVEKKQIQIRRCRRVTPGERVTTLSDDENDENVPCSSKRKKQKKSLKNATANDEKNIWFCRECGEEWDGNGDRLFAIFVAKLIIYNAVVYSTKHHNTGQFSLTNLCLSVKNAN